MPTDPSPYAPLLNALTTAAASGVALFLGFAWKTWQERKTKERHKPNLERDGRVDRDIYAVLNRLLDKIKAQRASLNKLQNGASYADLSEIWNYSRTHEAVRHGSSYEIASHQNILTSSVLEEMKLVLEDGPSWRRVETLPRGRFKFLCEQAGAVSVARCKVQKWSNTVGFIAVDFDTPDEPPDHCQAIVDAAYEIGQIITAAGY